MITGLWDVVLLLIGFGAIYCLIPLFLLSILGLILGLVMKIVTPPAKADVAHLSQADHYEPQGFAADDRPLTLDAILNWIDNGKIGVPVYSTMAAPQVGAWEDNKLFTREAWLGFGRWLLIVLLYAAGVGGTMVMSYLTSSFLAVTIRLPILVVIGIALIMLGLVALRQHIVPKFDEFPDVGWLVGTAAGIGVGIWASLATCFQVATCTEPSLILYAQLIGLVVGLGVSLGLITLTEWWAVWGDHYRTGRWVSGLLVGAIIAAPLTLLGLVPIGLLFGWLACVFIVTKNQRGSDTYYRRLLSGPLGLLMAGCTIALVGLGMARTCASVVHLPTLLRSWLITGALVGGVSGLFWLYLWQSASYAGHVSRLTALRWRW